MNDRAGLGVRSQTACAEPQGWMWASNLGLHSGSEALTLGSRGSDSLYPLPSYSHPLLHLHFGSILLGQGILMEVRNTFWRRA